MRRREFGLGILGTAGLLGADAVRGDGTSLATTRNTQDGQIGQLLFDSTGALLDENMEPLDDDDDSLVAIRAEPEGRIIDEDGNDDAIFYPDDISVPLVTVDESGSGTAVGIGAPLVDDGSLVPELEGEDPLGDVGNEEFLLNLYDEYVDGDTILWDEGHEQFYDLASFRNYAAYAEDNGYTLNSTEDLTADLSGADAIVITSPSAAFSDEETSALSEFIADGGLVVFHNQSDFNDFDETQNLNDVADALDLGFRFNDAQAVDDENNVGVNYLLLTSNFNDSDFSLFQDREGIVIDLRPGREYDVAVTNVADGDTFDVEFDGDDIGLETNYEGTVRVLGIDTPESADVAESAERPEEWEGLAYNPGGEPDPVDELIFDSAASLLDENEEPLTDDSLPVVYAESSATNQDADGNGDSVSYPDDVDIPLVAVDGSVVGVGAPLVSFGEDGIDVNADNDEFMLNVYDQVVDGTTVLWDEGHGQFYNLNRTGSFQDYAENQGGYDLQATDDIASDLTDADAVVVTTPSEAFSDAELDALAEFVQNGGAVLLHDQADFRNFDATANANEIAEALGVGFRFNDDQVVDEQNNTGQPFVPTTSNFDASGPLFETRAGIENDPDSRTTEYLTDWASNASEFVQALNDQNVTLFFDESEPIRDPTRLLAYARYDATGDGNRDTLYNKQVIEEGYARAYGSGLSRHDEFWAAERDAREANRRIWGESDVSVAPSYRDREPSNVFAPAANSIETAGSEPVERYANVFAESTATLADSNYPYTGDIPLFGEDADSKTAVTGSLLVDESYERLEGFDVSTAGYDNFSLVTQAIESLTEKEGPVYVDGGHGQFGTEYGLSSEDMAYYQRHLEGRGVNLEQINDLTQDRLGEARALIVTTPASALTEAELSAVQAFNDDGGAVVLMGSASAPEDVLANLNEVAAALGSALRVTNDQVLDAVNNVVDDDDILTTTQVGPAALPGDGTTPRDVDNDGVYEDLTGDGEFTISDVQKYYREVYQQRDTTYVRNNQQYFDVTGDGSVTLSDVQALFEQLN